MTDQEILKKAIEKAVINGVEPGFGKYVSMSLGYQTKVGETFEGWLIDFDTYRCIVFSHDFAKAFWGNYDIASCGLELMPIDFKKKYDKSRLDHYRPGHVTDWITMQDENDRYCYEQDDPECPCWTIPNWQYHLQQMVLEENPIKYLEAYL